MILVSGVVGQGWWCRYGYGSRLFHECYMRHGPYLTGVDHPLDHGGTSNYTPYILSCYPGYWNQEFLEPWTSSVMWWSKDNDWGMDIISHCIMSVIWVMGHVWLGYIIPQTTAWPPTTPQTCSAITLVFGMKSLNHWPRQWCPCFMSVTWVVNYVWQGWITP